MLRHRPRRLRRTQSLRDAVAECHLHPGQFILPLFVSEGRNLEEPITSMPGVSRWSVDRLPGQIEKAANMGVTSFAIFPRIDESKKDPSASESLNPNGLVPRTIQEFKKIFPDFTLFTDIALDPFSSDGHDGLVKDGCIVNDETVAVLAKMAVLHGQAGADFVAPSDMMDGRVGAIREALEASGLSSVGILSYAAKYASCFYGPFRDALGSAPKAGDKKTYQMDYRNLREAMREVDLDVIEGADAVMVKPAGAYLDVIHAVKARVNLPVAAYQVSGEYSLLVHGAKSGLFSLDSAVLESLFAIRRAGADWIFTYFALEAARLLRK